MEIHELVELGISYDLELSCAKLSNPTGLSLRYLVVSQPFI